MHVVNPYARDLTFVDGRTRARRDHMKYLTLIRTIALLHQFQRERKVIGEGRERIEYIEATLSDIALANELAHEVLGRSLDELPPQTRRLLYLIDEMVVSECRRLKMKRADFHFSRKLVRDSSGWSETQLRVHLGRLVDLEVAPTVDVVAVALHSRMTVEQMTALDLSYAPPFAPVWDPVLVAARKATEAIQQTH